MAKYIGRRVSLGVGRESTRATGATPVLWVPKVDFSFDDRVERVDVNSDVGRIEDSYQSHVLTKYGDGDVGAEVRSQSFGYFLYAMTGTCSSGGVVDSSYTHTFTAAANTNQHQSLTFTVVDPNTTEQYALVMLNSLELTQELGDILRFNAGFMGKTARGASATASYTTEYKFTKKHFSLKLAATTAGLAAASAISVKAFSMTISKNVVLDDVLGTAEPEDILNQQMSVEGSVTLNYEAETYKNYMIDNTARAMRVDWTNTDQTIGAGSTNPQMTLDLSKVNFFDVEANYALDEIVTQTMSFKGHYDLGGNDNLFNSITLVNGKSAYTA